MNGCPTCPRCAGLLLPPRSRRSWPRVGVPVGGPAEEVITTTLGPYVEGSGRKQLTLVEINMEGHASRYCGG